MLINPETWQKALLLNKFANIDKITSPEPAVFLPGWGFDGRIIDLTDHKGRWIYPLAPVQAVSLASDLEDLLHRNNIRRIHLAGWSMGAYTGLDFAAAHPDKIASLTLLAARSSWTAAEIEQIRSAFITDPAGFLQEFYRKCFMGYKAVYRRFVKNLQDDYLTRIDTDALVAGLEYLQTFRPAANYPNPTIIHGKRDLVAPLAQRLTLANSREITIKHGGHPVFLDKEFNYPITTRKDVIRRKFSRAASSYDQHAQVQRELAEKLARRSPHLPDSAKILEIGCGTGNYTAALAKKYPSAKICALDFSANMLAQAQKKLVKQSNIKLLCRDGEQYLSQNPGNFDYITSNATMQWFDNLAPAAHNIAVSLAPDGIMCASIFGPRTMEKVAQGLTEVLGHKNIVPSSTFSSQAELQEIFSKHFATVHIDELIITRHYKSLHELLKYVQKTGTSGGQLSPPFFSRRHLHQLDQWFADKFNGYFITNQVFMITVRTPKY